MFCTWPCGWFLAFGCCKSGCPREEGYSMANDCCIINSTSSSSSFLVRVRLCCYVWYSMLWLIYKYIKCSVCIMLYMYIRKKKKKKRVRWKKKRKEKKKEQALMPCLIYIYYVTKACQCVDCHPTTFSCLCALASICCTPFLVYIHVHHPLRPWEHLANHPSLFSVSFMLVWPFVMSVYCTKAISILTKLLFGHVDLHSVLC